MPELTLVFANCSLWIGKTGESGGVAADSNTGQAYGEHSVACIGYMEGSTTQNRWVTIYDTWDTGRSHLLQYQNWWNAQETYVRP